MKNYEIIVDNLKYQTQSYYYGETVKILTTETDSEYIKLSKNIMQVKNMSNNKERHLLWLDTSKKECCLLIRVKFLTTEESNEKIEMLDIVNKMDEWNKNYKRDKKNSLLTDNSIIRKVKIRKYNEEKLEYERVFNWAKLVSVEKKVEIAGYAVISYKIEISNYL